MTCTVIDLPNGGYAMVHGDKPFEPGSDTDKAIRAVCAAALKHYSTITTIPKLVAPVDSEAPESSQ